MLPKPSLMTRIAVGKGIGLLIGLVGFLVLPLHFPEVSAYQRWGILLWYTTLGGLIGLFGVMDQHPVLKLPMRWWLRGPFVGAWMNFVLALFAYEAMASTLQATFGDHGALASPFWFVVQGAIIGLIIGYLATRFGGEGKETAGR